MTIIYSIPAVRDAWADTAVPTTDIVDPGNAIVAAGWLQSTTPPPRQYFNWALNWAANAVRYFMQNGIVDWQAAELYQQGSIVVFNNFVYQSLINNNTNNTPPAAQTSNANWSPLIGYATLQALTAYVTTAQLNAALAAYAALNSPSFTGIPLAPTANAGTSNNQLATTAFAALAAANALAAAEAFSANANNLSAGTVPNPRLPNIGSMPGVTIAADPGTTPSGSPGQIFFYY